MGTELQHDRIGKGQIKQLFGVMSDSIITSAFDIVHRKEEEERCRKKEQERKEKEAKLERLVNEIHTHLGIQPILYQK